MGRLCDRPSPDQAVSLCYASAGFPAGSVAIANVSAAVRRIVLDVPHDGLCSMRFHGNAHQVNAFEPLSLLSYAPHPW